MTTSNHGGTDSSALTGDYYSRYTFWCLEVDESCQEGDGCTLQDKIDALLNS